MEPRRRGLGRGLGALIPSVPATMAEERSGDGSSAPIASIRPNPQQPREGFSEEALEELTASIRENGLLQPLLVRRSNGGYELIAGERRLRAARRAGLDHVPVTVREADDRQSLELALIENLQREDLNAMEEARAYRRLGDEFGLSQEEIARRVGKQRSTVANTLRLLLLPDDIQSQIENGTLSAGHARSLLGLESSSDQRDTARKVVDRGLSVRETEQLVRSHARASLPEDADLRALESELTRALGTRVRIRPGRKGGGRIEIEYYSDEELTGLVHRFVEDGALA